LKNGKRHQKRRNHLSVGFVGSPYIAQVLSDNGRLDVAYDLLHQTLTLHGCMP
jgi:hypothetical protein